MKVVFALAVVLLSASPVFAQGVQPNDATNPSTQINRDLQRQIDEFIRDFQANPNMPEAIKKLADEAKKKQIGTIPPEERLVIPDITKLTDRQLQEFQAVQLVILNRGISNIEQYQHMSVVSLINLLSLTPMSMQASSVPNHPDAITSMNDAISTSVQSVKNTTMSLIATLETNAAKVEERSEVIDSMKRINRP